MDTYVKTRLTEREALEIYMMVEAHIRDLESSHYADDVYEYRTRAKEHQLKALLEKLGKNGENLI